MKFNFFKKIWGKRENGEDEKIDQKIDQDKNLQEKKIEVKNFSRLKILPLLTEKSSFFSKHGKYLFMVDEKMNKNQIKEAVERIFSVDVENVKTMNYKKRIRGRTKIKSVRSKFKKAIVQLKKGQTISIFE